MPNVYRVSAHAETHTRTVHKPIGRARMGFSWPEDTRLQYTNFAC